MKTDISNSGLSDEMRKGFETALGTMIPELKSRFSQLFQVFQKDRSEPAVDRLTSFLKYVDEMS